MTFSLSTCLTILLTRNVHSLGFKALDRNSINLVKSPVPIARLQCVPETRGLKTKFLMSVDYMQLINTRQNLQPSQSFKYRGISLFAQHCKATRGDDVHLIIPSGGNAGLACACAANRLGLKCTVYLPKGTDEHMIARLKKENAEVIIFGDYYLEAAQEARRAVERDANAC